MLKSLKSIKIGFCRVDDVTRYLPMMKAAMKRAVLVFKPGVAEAITEGLVAVSSSSKRLIANNG